MKRIKYMAGVAIAAIAISSCDEDTATIGNSLTDESDKLDVTPAVFYATTRTVVADSVLSLSSSCYLGKVKDPETGAEVKSEFSTQFHILEGFYISPEERIIGRNAENRAVADSCDIILYLSSPYKSDDSLTAMKLLVRELDSPIEGGKKYYTNYDPVKLGLIRTDGINRSKMFTYKNMADTDTERSGSSYLENIRITLNEPYTAKDGTTYPNYGSYILRQYYDHPEYFRNSYTFAHNVCPGFFFEVTDGLGFHSQISNIGLRVFYDVQTPDTAFQAAFTVAGTKEVLQTNKITNDMDAINRLAQNDDCTYLKTPSGLFTEVTLPIDEIKLNHEADSLLATRITFQRLNNQSFDNRVLGISQTVLMLPKDSLTSYFEKLEVPNSKTSFYTTFSSSSNTYSFTNVSRLITDLWNKKTTGLAADAAWVEKHPNWNKVLLVPISYTSSSTSTTPTRVEHDMSLTSTQLVGGKNNPIEVSVVYAKFHE